MLRIIRRIINNRIRIFFALLTVLFFMILSNIPSSIVRASSIVRYDPDGTVWYMGDIKERKVEDVEDYSFNTSYEPYDFYTYDETILDTFSPFFDWRLILVNKENPLDENYACNLIKCDDFEVESRIYFDLNNMIDDARYEGYDLYLASGYRDYNTQQYLFNRKYNYFKSLGFSDDEAYTAAARQVSPPLTSEHETGLAVDILSYKHQTMDTDFGTTDEGVWLKEHCYEYGFILRYPEGSESVTGIMYEPWHFRYVGVEAAEIIHRHNITFEEFYSMIEKNDNYLREDENGNMVENGVLLDNINKNPSKEIEDGEDGLEDSEEDNE